MKRVKLIIAYDGTAYHGWQIQSNARTIEGVVTEALTSLLGTAPELIGASRTDAGVHALGNVAVFDTDAAMPAQKFAPALNQRLPEDIRVLSSEEVAPDFHPRHCESIKTYEYHIYNAKMSNPMKRLYSHFSYTPFDIELMREAANYLVGEHDFASFCAAGSTAETTIREITEIEIIETRDAFAASREIIIRVRGKGFLYNMVRIIAGTLMEVGCGKRTPESMEDVIKAVNRSAAGPTAPACGLTLVGIDYM